MTSNGSWFDDVFGHDRPDDGGSGPTSEADARLSSTNSPSSTDDPSFPNDSRYGPAARPEQFRPWSDDSYGSEPTAPLFPVGSIPAIARPTSMPTALPTSMPTPYEPDPYRAGSAGPAGAAWSAPTVPVLPVPAPPVRRRRGPRAGTIVLVAALTAAVVGGAAGYGGTRYAQWQAGGGGLGTATGPASSPSSASGAAPSTAASSGTVAEQVLASTVTIRVASGAPGDLGSIGSGLVMDQTGRILTTNQVVRSAGDGGRLQVVFADGRTEIGSVVGSSPSYDLAVVQVGASADLTPVRFGDSDQTRVGETALAVGSALGQGGAVTEGIISATHRPVAENDTGDSDATSAYIDALQTDAPISSQNAGGPLANSAGEVIGVNSAVLTLGYGQAQSGGADPGFAIPINQARRIAQELIAAGVATYPTVGLNVTAAGPSAAGSDGVLVQSVAYDGAAAQAGLLAGDVVSAVDDTPVTGAAEFIVALRTHRPGDTVTVSYQRGGLAQQARVLLGSKEG